MIYLPDIEHHVCMANADELREVLQVTTLRVRSIEPCPVTVLLCPT